MRMKKSTIMEGGEDQHYRKGLWTTEEDKILMDYVKLHGKGNWNHISKKTGLKRCGKSCRLRWMNYLSPSVKKGDFTQDEEDLIIRLHNLLGNRWSLIAKRVPGRTDNQVKNYWNTHLSKKVGRTKRQNNEFSDSSLTKPMRLDFPKNIGTETSAITSTTIISNQIIPNDHKVVQNAFDHVCISETQESTIAEGFVMNPSWISDDHDFDLGYTFTMMEFLEGYYSTIF